MFRKLSALLAGVLLCSLASSQSVPNGGVITTGQVWTVAQWNNAWQSKFDVTGGTLTAPTINNPAITGGTQSTPVISSPTISGTVAGSPTNVGNWTFQPSGGTGLTVNGIPGAFAQIVNGTTSTGNSFGLAMNAGTNGSDVAFQINNAASTQNFMNVWGNGGITLTAVADEGLGTFNAVQLYNSGSLVPAVNQSPTWTGDHVFNPATGHPVQINSGGQNLLLTGNAFTGAQYLLGIDTGTDSLTISRADTAHDIMDLTLAGGVVINPSTSGSALTINGSSATTGALVVNGANCTGPCQAMTINGGSNNNNVALALKSNSEGEGLIVFGNTVAGQSHGLSVLAGTNSSDANMAWADASGATAFGTVWGDGGFSIGPVGTADCGAGCLNASSNLKVAGASVLTTASTASALTSVGTLGSLNVSGAAAVGSLTVGGVADNPQRTAHVATNQSSTTTTAAATALSLTLPLGSYAIEIFLDFNGTTTGTQGIKFNTTTGTSVASVFLGSAVGSVAGTPINGNSVSNFTFTNTSVASSVDFLVIKYSVTITTAGTYVVSMAQNSSSGNAANLLTGSYIIATKI